MDTFTAWMIGCSVLIGITLAGIIVLGLWAMARVWQATEADDSPWPLNQELRSDIGLQSHLDQPKKPAYRVLALLLGLLAVSLGVLRSL